MSTKINDISTKINDISEMSTKLANLKAMLYIKEISKSIHTTIHRSIDNGQYKSKLKLKKKEDIDDFKKDLQEFDRIDKEVIRKPRNDEVHNIGKLENQDRKKI